MNIFALLGQASNIRRLLTLWEQNKAPVTEMIDTARGILTAIDVLNAPAADGNPVPVPLRQYNTEWIQETLNKLDNAGITVDGELGKKTEQAVAKFQEAHGLKADGFPGIQTVAVMAAERDKAGK